jgi:hypothetical protein
MNQKRIFLLPLFQMTAGLGWIGGTYAEPAQSLWLQILLQVLHALPVGLLFLFGVRFLTSAQTEGDWGRSGLIGLAILVKLLTITWIIIGFTHIMGLSGPHTFDDWFPIGMTNAGSGLLLGLLITRRDRLVRPAPVPVVAP